MRRIAKPFAAFLALFLAPMLAPAHPLADKIPADALMYMGWEGTDALGAAYDNSNLKGIVDAMNFKNLLSQAWAKGMLDAQAQGKADDAKLMGDLATALLKSPTAFYIAGLDVTDPQKPVPQMTLISQVGKTAPDLAKALGDLLDKNRKPTDPPSAAKAIGDYLVVTIGTPPDLTPYLTGAADNLPKPPLSADKAFLDAAKQVSPTSAFTLYVNGQSVLHAIGEAAKAAPQRPNAPPFEQIMDALGLNAIKHAMVTGGFDGKNWSTQAFVELAPDRHGLAAFMDNKPLSDAALKSIPKDASWASVTRFDGSRLLADVRSGAVLLDPGAAAQINSGILQAGNMMGIDFEKDLVGNQSDEWILYGNAGAAGNSIRGITLVDGVKDEKIAAQTFDTLSSALNLMIASRGGQDAKLIVANKAGDLTLHSIELANSAPTWTVANGKFIFALMPAAAEAAAHFDGKQTLADNPEFQALVKQLGVDKYSSFSFVDAPKTAPEAYEVWTRIITYANAQAKDGNPKIVLPPLDKITPFLSPSLDLWWSDAAGLHLKSAEAFPMSAIFGGSNFSMDAIAFAIARERAAAAAKPGQRGQPDTPPKDPATGTTTGTPNN